MNHHSRAMSGAVRQAIITSYANGNSIGFETAQRSLWEIGDTMADIHGRRKAAEAIYRIADEIVAGDFVTPLEIASVGGDVRLTK